MLFFIVAIFTAKSKYFFTNGIKHLVIYTRATLNHYLYRCNNFNIFKFIQKFKANDYKRNMYMDIIIGQRFYR